MSLGVRTWGRQRTIPILGAHFDKGRPGLSSSEAGFLIPLGASLSVIGWGLFASLKRWGNWYPTTPLAWNLATTAAVGAVGIVTLAWGLLSSAGGG
jgi:hypothetical protein